MRKFNFILVMSFSVLIACNNPSKKAPEGLGKKVDTIAENTVIKTVAKRYEIKSAIVYYKSIELMKGIKTTDILYFDDFGAKEAKEKITETIIKGKKNREKSISLLVDGFAASYTLEKLENGIDVTPKEAYKMKIDENANQMGQALGANLSDDMKKQYNYREEGTEVVAGVEGEKFSVAMGDDNVKDRIYGVLYKNIPIKTYLGKINIEAERIEVNVTIPSSKFEIPSGYKIIESKAENRMNKNVPFRN